MAVVCATVLIFILIGGPPLLLPDIAWYWFALIYVAALGLFYGLSLVLLVPALVRHLASTTHLELLETPMAKSLIAAAGPHTPLGRARSGVELEELRECAVVSSSTSPTWELPPFVSPADDASEAVPGLEERPASQLQFPTDSEEQVQGQGHAEVMDALNGERLFVPLMVVTACSVAFAHGGSLGSLGGHCGSRSPAACRQ